MADTFGDAQQAMLDATTRRPRVPWGAFVLLIVWCAVEATIFAFALRPTMSELLSDLTGLKVNPIALVLVLWVFLTIIIAGSFACRQHRPNDRGANRRRDVPSALPVPRIGRRHGAMAGAARPRVWHCCYARPRLLRVGRRARHDVVPNRPFWRARADHGAQPPSWHTPLASRFVGSFPDRRDDSRDSIANKRQTARPKSSATRSSRDGGI